MCVTCGCDNVEAIAHGPQDEHAAERRATVYRHGRPSDPLGHWHPDGTWHSHDHARETTAGTPDSSDSSNPVASEASRTLRIERDILARNDATAAVNRRRFADHGVFTLNLVSSPGSGKTTLVVETARAWQGRTPLAVIEGDQRTSLDADRVRAVGVDAVQINTAKGCHLDAQMVGQALDKLCVADDSVLLIENVGNLVCPAAFDLGEAHKVVILSVTEGEDKPLKYPDMFHAADLMIINKADLLPYVDFDVATAIEYARRVRPEIAAIVLSARTGAGFDEWLAWLEAGMLRAIRARQGSVDALRRRVAELEAQLRAVPAT